MTSQNDDKVTTVIVIFYSFAEHCHTQNLILDHSYVSGDDDEAYLRCVKCITRCISGIYWLYLMQISDISQVYFNLISGLYPAFLKLILGILHEYIMHFSDIPIPILWCKYHTDIDFLNYTYLYKY